MKINAIGSKIIQLDTIENVLLKWKKENSVIVFTNGCFDILHYGHIHYLADAKDLGDKLVVGMNSANSVRRLKGETRPINDELTRLYMLASLEIVDAVISFEEDTPYNLIKLIKPDILLKGGDWRTEQIVGSDIVLSNGGIVKSLPFIEGYSTTNIEKKIRGW